MEHQLFVIIKDILSTHPLNQETQLKIEELVFNGFKEFYSDPNEVIKILGGFNPQLVSNAKFIKFIHFTLDNIKSLLKQLKLAVSENINKKKSKKAQNHIQLLESILLNINNKDFVTPAACGWRQAKPRVIISTLFKIITYNMIIQYNDDGHSYYKTNLLNLSIDLGGKIVEYYVRNLYKKHKESPSRLKGGGFLSESFNKELILRSYKLREFKENLLADPLHNNLDQPEFLVYIVSELIKIMKECGLIEDKIIVTEDKKLTVLILTQEVLQLFGEDLLHKTLDIPLNLPMIVEPKDYKDLNNFSDGGYILNNESIIHSLFTNNITQIGKTIIKKDNKVIESINGIMKVPFKIIQNLLTIF